MAAKTAAGNPELAAFLAGLKQGGVSEAELETQEKRGMATGLWAIHLVTGQDVPVYVANFVLMNYGTGAVMAVPAHDQRDWEFANAYGLPVTPVAVPPQVRDALGEITTDVRDHADPMQVALGEHAALDVYDTDAAVAVVREFMRGIEEDGAYTERGFLINSGDYNGMDLMPHSTRWRRHSKRTALVRFIPAPRRHLHRYHGAFAPHCALRARVVTRAGQAIAPPVAAPDDLAKVIHHEPGQSPHASYAPAPVPAVPAQARSWARLIARIHEVDPLRCRHGGGAMRLIVFIVESAVIVRLLDHPGEPSRAPRRVPIRGPPGAHECWVAIVDSDNDATYPNPATQVMPDYESQRQDQSRGEAVAPVGYLSKQESGVSAVAQWTRQGCFVLYSHAERALDFLSLSKAARWQAGGEVFAR